ncbi:MAG TPA: MoaD/ThiS family protein [Spirochaetia bacterium]|nr:MoaD/ThiS family protein [Spirochaetia bacterium]
MEDTVTVRIRYLSGLRNTTGIPSEEVRFPVGTPLRDVSQWLARKYGITAPGPGVMSTLNGRGWSQTALALETQLSDGDEISLFPLLSGG